MNKNKTKPLCPSTSSGHLPLKKGEVNIYERKYQIELEVVDVRSQVEPKKILKIARKNLKTMILNKLEGKTGMC
jgi:hypothetical protein